MKNIVLKEAATITANGNLNSRNCKSVCRIDKFGVITFYTSVTDAAHSNGIFPQNMSRILIHSNNFKGNIFCYVKDLYKYLDCIAERSQGISTMAGKAAAYDAMLAEQKARDEAKEAERKAKEKAEIDHQKAITKVTERLERKRTLYERKHRELDEVYQSVLEAERELANLTETKKRPMVPYEIIPRGDQFELVINGIERGLYDSEEKAELIVDWYIKHER